MEDPSLLEESSTPLDPNEVNRVAPLRLGWVCFCGFPQFKRIKLFLEISILCTSAICVWNRSVNTSQSPPTHQLRLPSLVRQQRSPEVEINSQSTFTNVRRNQKINKQYTANLSFIVKIVSTVLFHWQELKQGIFIFLLLLLLKFFLEVLSIPAQNINNSGDRLSPFVTDLWLESLAGNVFPLLRGCCGEFAEEMCSWGRQTLKILWRTRLRSVLFNKPKLGLVVSKICLTVNWVENHTDFLWNWSDAVPVSSPNCMMFPQGDQVHKSVFIIFFQGDQLKNRVKKICEG